MLATFVVLFACSNDSGGIDAGPTATCDDNSGACAPQCIPYALCTSEGSTCVIGGASCGHYWVCHDTTWISDTSHDCDSGSAQPDASSDAGVDATLDAQPDSPPADAADEADGAGDGALLDDGAAADGDDAG